MKALLIVFFSSIYLYGFFWGNFTQFEKTKGVISKAKSIDLYYTIQAKKQVEYIQAMALLSLNATYNDTIDDENIITYRTIPNISDLYATLVDVNDEGGLNSRERLVFNAIDKGLVDHDQYVTNSSEVHDYFDPSFTISCSVMVGNGNTKFPSIFNNNITDVECIGAQARNNDFYGASVFLIDIPTDDILNKYESKIKFEDSLDSIGNLGRNSSVFVSKYKYAVNQDRELIQKINYFTYEQLLEYSNKYISTKKTFISKDPIIEAMQNRVDVLQDNNTSASLVALETTLGTYSFNQYDSIINYSNNTTNTCLEQKAILEDTINALQPILSGLISDITDKEDEIADWQGLEYLYRGNPTLYIIWQTQLDTLMGELVDLNNQKDTTNSSISTYQTQLSALGC